MTREPWPSTHLSVLLGVRDPQNSAAWAEFVQRYRLPVVQFCRGRFRVQDALAEDVAQNVLLKLITAMQEFEYDPQKSFRGWLKTVTKNAAVDYLREEAARIGAGTGDSRAQEALQNTLAEDSAEELSDVLFHELRGDLLRQAEDLVRERVDPETWEVYQGRCRGEPARAMGEMLHMKVAAVHKAYSRVKRMLREEVAMLLKQPDARGLKDGRVASGRRCRGVAGEPQGHESTHRR